MSANNAGRVHRLLHHILRHGGSPQQQQASPGANDADAAAATNSSSAAAGAPGGPSPGSGGLRRSSPPGASAAAGAAAGAADREGAAAVQRIRIGIAAMDKKAQSKPMREIVGRLLRFGEFEVVNFGDQVILDEPIEAWPDCECLLSWYSDGFPLAKAQAYAALRRPFLVNDLHMQDVLMDRRRVYRILESNGIPLPTHVVVDRDGLEEGQDPEGFVEEEDYVEMDGRRIHKPFVEKPVSGEDHNVFIYYPHSMGGGVKRLFRKVHDKSSQYDPDHPGTVRRDGSYIYEEFLPTGGTDVKVYTVGPRYAHAEARKSPVVDGRVLRAPDGKEIRFPVLLSPQEKEIARMVCLAFGQKVCGFDLLRSDAGRSYVCDVNGWSFVKNSKKYYDDAAGILRSIVLSALAPHRLTLAPDPLPPLSRASIARFGVAAYGDQPPTPDGAAAGGGFEVEGNGGDLPLLQELSLADLNGVDALEAHATDERSAKEELRCVLAVIRHGDRTPKQKLKMRVTQPELLALFHKYADAKGKQAKLKSPLQLQELLDTSRGLLQRLEDPSSAQGLTPEEKEARDEAREKFRILRTVLEQGGHFSGINRKVQLKPLRWSGTAPRGIDRDATVSSAPSRPLSAQSSTTGATLLQQAANLLAASEGDAAATPSPAGGAAVGVGSVGGGGNGNGSSSGGGAAAAPNGTGDAGEQQLRQRGRSESGGGGGNGSSGAAGEGSVVAAAASTDAPKPAVEELLLILKWGGVLTHAGRRQAEDLGRTFRLVMYPRYGSVGGGLLRLHSTYRHDLKIYSSDEGRVQTSAAAFIKGLLDLEGASLTPILVSLVQKDASMLDAFGKGASEDIRAAKALLYNTMTFDPDAPPPSAPSATSAAAATDGNGGNAEGAAAAPPRPPLAVTPPLPLPSPPRTPGDATAAASSGRISRTSSGSVATSVRAASATVAAAAASIEQEQRSAAAAAAAAATPLSAAPSAQLGPRGSQEQRQSTPFDRAAFDAARAVITNMPENPLAHLKRLHELMGALVDQLRARCMAESGANAAGNGPPPAPKRFSSLSQDPKEWELDPSRPCSGEKPLLMLDRWQKLHRSFCKKGRYDISKVPDIFDCAKYDAIHNGHLGLTGLGALYAEAKVLADAVIPNEYGTDPTGKLRIGSKICSELLGKLLIDLDSMRAESMATLGDEDDIEGDDEGGGLVGAEEGGDDWGERIDPDDPSGSDAERPPSRGFRRARETTYRLCPNYASDINSPLRHVRTRIYFTSESHMHSLVNVLRYAHMSAAGLNGAAAAAALGADSSGGGGAAAAGVSSSSGGAAAAAGAAPNAAAASGGGGGGGGGGVGGSAHPLLTDEGMDLLKATTELCYCSHLVLRLYENKAVPADAPERFRVEVLFSPGAAHDPTQVEPPQHDHTLPVLPRAQLHPGPGICLSEFSQLLSPFSTDPLPRRQQQKQPQRLF